MQNVPNRQLHTTTKASKSFPDCSTVDQGEGEAQGEESGGRGKSKLIANVSWKGGRRGAIGAFYLCRWRGAWPASWRGERQPKGHTGEEVCRFNPVEGGREGAVGCDVWVHLKARADLFILRGAGWEAEGREVVVVVGWFGLWLWQWWTACGNQLRRSEKTPALSCMSSAQLEQDAGGGSLPKRQLRKWAGGPPPLPLLLESHKFTDMFTNTAQRDWRLFKQDSCCVLKDKLFAIVVKREAERTRLRGHYCKVIEQVNV